MQHTKKPVTDDCQKARQSDCLDDWVSFEQLAEEYPSYPIKTLRYLFRAEVRKATGFDSCVRFITARNAVISRSRFAAWIEQRGV